MALLAGAVLGTALMAAAPAGARSTVGHWRSSASGPSSPRASLERAFSAGGPLTPFTSQHPWDGARAHLFARPRSLRRAHSGVARPAVGGATGTISGEVTAAGSDAPLGEVEVCAFEEEPPFSEDCTETNTSGEYTISGLESGEYLVGFFPLQETGPQYVTQFYDEVATPEEATLLTVSAGGTLRGIDASLPEGTEISGTVTSAATKQALAGIEVCAIQRNTGIGGCAATNASGEYAVRGLYTGSYVVSFSEPFQGVGNYATQYYNGKARSAEGEPVSVTAGKPGKQGIDAALAEGGQIEGTVTALAGGDPLPEIEVCAISLEVEMVRCTTTEAGGHYDINSLSTAEYYVEFSSFTGEYQSQFYNDTTKFADAEQLSIEAGHVVGGIDAALALAPPQEISPPVVLGNAVEGQTLKVQHGAWTGNPTSYEDKWYSCNAENLCRQVGEGESYTVKTSDVGRRIGVIEHARNSVGEGGPSYSELSSVVTSAPSQSHESGSAQGSPPAPPAPAPAIGVLSSTTVVASAAQLTSLLDELLAPTGKNAKIEALLKHGGYALSFDALTAGQLTISWYVVPKGAHLARAKATLVARGHVSVSAAGAAKLAIRLTANGRALLKHARQLKLTALGSIAPLGRATIGATKSFVLKR